jgi:hypothetical protein
MGTKILDLPDIDTLDPDNDYVPVSRSGATFRAPASAFGGGGDPIDLASGDVTGVLPAVKGGMPQPLDVTDEPQFGTVRADRIGIGVAVDGTIPVKVVGHVQVAGQIQTPIKYNGSTGLGTKTIDLNLSNVHFITMTAEFALFINNPTDGGVYKILVYNQGAGWAIIWPSGILWPSGGAPPSSGVDGAIDEYELTYVGTLLSSFVGRFVETYLTP